MIELNHNLTHCPFESFAKWFESAAQCEDSYDAFSLATCGKDRRPSCRYLLLKDHGHDGLKFYTNKNSLKGRQISEIPFGEMAFFWRKLGRQVRVSGKLEPLDRSETSQIYEKRATESKLATQISRQGQKLKSRDELLSSYHEARNSLTEKELHLPDHWEGYRLIPDCFVFFIYGEHRLNERFCYELKGSTWNISLLYP